MKILIADDDPGIRRGLSAQVRSDGFETVACENGQEAERILTGDNAPEVAVLDWMMPSRTGPEICRTVRRPDHPVMPYIIILTVKTDAQDIAEALDAGANDYITKPFSLMELRARIRVGRRTAELHQKLQACMTGIAEARQDIANLESLFPVCPHCRKLRSDHGHAEALTAYLETHNDRRLGSTCPACAETTVSGATGGTANGASAS